jgi:hypothetical protein
MLISKIEDRCSSHLTLEKLIKRIEKEIDEKKKLLETIFANLRKINSELQGAASSPFLH